MICELQIKLNNGKTPLLFYSNRLIAEIEKVCEVNNWFKLYEVYRKALIYPAQHSLIIDSYLLDSPAEKRNERKIRNQEENEKDTNIEPELTFDEEV